MPLLADYAITPDVFDVTSYTNDEICRLHLKQIGNVMRTEGLVRDLRAGSWRALVANGERPWHRRGKELVKKLATQGRLINFPPALPTDPVDDHGWCDEAIATHAKLPLTGGVIVTQPIKDAHRSEPFVASIDRLDGAAWWSPGDPSIRLGRNVQEYRQHLGLILRHANSIQLIDPHLDPTKPRYSGVVELLRAAGRRTPAPLVEIHRAGYEGSGGRRNCLDIDHLKEDFRGTLASGLRSVGLRVDVFVWDRFHDRYLISNLLGISLPNGFDTSPESAEITTWTRLGRAARDDVQREFDVASHRHKLMGRFAIP